MSGRRAHKAGFTLLELIVALAILGMVMTGVAMLWSQARSWQDEQTLHRETLRVERVLSAVREQWFGRRVLGDDVGAGAGVEAQPGSITFVSSRSVLFDGWPLVRVRYTVERDVFGSANGSGYALVLEEARITDPSELPAFEGGGFDDRGAPLTARTMLIGGASRLVLERFGTRAGPPCGGAIDDGSGDGEGADADTEGEAEGLDLGVRLDSDADCAMVWRAFDEEVEQTPRALRIVGTKRGEVIACVFEVAALR